ncbi:hypothetical protein AARAC_008697 [Aspergillus arachidicola]|uniref:Ferric oxidoreductase domain-containing protein n=1 Tax=Aspergillus arachidicola TaxID=656916 RepID=A0A2G7EL19_9EURO|nr:hypothetical protein AARAC_008697 [Aspergillus arachidicola]
MILTSPVLLSHSYYLVALHSCLAKDQVLPKSMRLSWSVMGYWGGILLMGIVYRLWASSRYVQGGGDRGDVERKREQQLSDKAGIRNRLSFYWKAYIAVPAALGSYHQRRFLGCSIPNRPEILVVVGFWIMCIILNFGFHDIFIPNVTMPTISQQAWKYVAQRTSMFAYACLLWVWLFAGRNNIFIWVTGWSFSTFNVFHRHLSRLTAIFAFVHAISYTVLDTIYGPYYEEGLHVLWFKFGIIRYSSAAGAVAIDYNAAPSDLTTLPSGSLFETWRPKIHVLPPTGRIGDPCAHYNDPKTGWFHVQYLYNGTGIAGVQTDDLVYYYDINENGNYTGVAGGANDPLAVFDGSVISRGIDDKPTLLYTSVSHLPIHWTLPYTRGSESQSLAGFYVTAFRDPYVFQNKDLYDTVGSSSGTWYAVISGGVHDWSEPANSTWGNGNWAKVWGYNFEVGNVFSLDKEGYNVNGETFITLGVEGSYVPITESVTSMHRMLWASGNISKPDGGNVTFEPTMAGVLDWGTSSYTAAGKVLPATSRASEKSSAPDRFISRDGKIRYCSVLPRKLSKQTISNVVNNDLASETGLWRVEGSENSCLKLETMGIKIARETYKAMTNKTSFTEPKRTLSEAGAVPFEQSPTPKFFVLNAQLSFSKSARDSGVQAGFKILSSELESTTIYYQFSNEPIVIDRSNTSAAAQTATGTDTATESGRLRLFDINKNCKDDNKDKSDDDNKQEERKKKDAYREHGRNRHNVKHNAFAAEDESQIEILDLTIVVDNAVLEVYNVMLVYVNEHMMDGNVIELGKES